MSDTFEFAVRCVELGDLLGTGPAVDLLQAMYDTAQDITYTTMRRRCSDLPDWERQFGYAARRRDGLVLQDDWHVAYCRGRFGGFPCYYLVWSAIENIWLPPGAWDQILTRYQRAETADEEFDQTVAGLVARGTTHGRLAAGA